MADFENDENTHEYETLFVLLNKFIKDNINTELKIDTVVRCAINYCHKQACVPLWEWRNEFEIMKREEFAKLYQKYINYNDDKWNEYNLKKLYKIALKFDNEDEQCKIIYYQQFPEENREFKKELKEERREEQDRIKEEKRIKKQERREEQDRIREEQDKIREGKQRERQERWEEQDRIREEKLREKEREKERKEDEKIEKERKYEDMKDDFEEIHFKCGDQFYKIFENKLQAYSKQSFCTVYQDYRIDEKKSFLDMWLNDPDKRQYDKIDFVPPPIKCKSSTFNTWDLTEGFDDLVINSQVNTQIFYDFFKYICCKQDDVYEYVIKYISHLLQYPAIKPQVGLFFTGSQGGGKDTLALIIKKLIGIENVLIECDPDNVFGKFNWRRMNKLVVCLQETDNIKSYAGKIKDLITCETTTLSDKCVKGIDVNDFTRLLIFSNHENIINVEPTDRRFVIIKTWDFHHDPQTNFFNELYQAINNDDMINKLRHELLSYNINKDFNFQKNRPITEIYKDLKQINTPSIVRWAWDITQLHEVNELSSSELCNHYNNWCKTAFENSKEVNVKSFGLNLKKYFCINNEWRGFEKKLTNKSSIYCIQKETLKSIIEDKYGYIGEI